MADGETKTNIAKKQLFAEKLKKKVRIAKFNGTVIIQSNRQWHDMTSERFAVACYREFGDSISKSMIMELEHLFRTTAEDLSSYSHLILFQDNVWNMRKAVWEQVADEDREHIVYGVPYIATSGDERIPFILDLACGNEDLYDDIMQSIAPLILHRKPTGIIWYLGGGRNGKSSLVHLLHLVFGEYLTQITVKQIEDERDAPHLNGKLGNVPTESSESLIKDTRTYKSIGTHEDFMVHKFHSQEMTSVNGNVHHVFSTNNIPTFSDKSDGAKRRTLIIPFNNRFVVDEEFEERLFTKEFIERFVGEVVKYAQSLKANGYSYKFSLASRAVKDQYDIDSNTGNAYADELIAEGVVGFTSYRPLFIDYENWCQDNGYSPSSINVFRRAMKDKDFSRKPRRVGKLINQVYVLGKILTTDVINFSDKRPGLFKLTDMKELSNQEELS